MSRRSDKGASFVSHFEGAAVLDELLALAGSPLDSRGVLERMQAAQQAGEPREAVVPTLFEGEPRFPSPEVARRLFQNLLGLWEALEEGRPVGLAEAHPPRPKRPKPPPRPGPFAPGEPDTPWVEAAWRYLEGDARGRVRLLHSFENRQDALLGVLDASGLGDEGYAVARHLLFELHAMLELGWPAGLAAVSPRALEAARDPAAPPVPPALAAYAEEALFEAEQDEEQPLPPEERERVRGLVERGLAAMWAARKG